MGKMSIGTGLGSGATRAMKAASGPSNDAPPVVITAPALSGAGRIGAPVIADIGVWGGRPAPSFALRWQRDGADIPGATGASYTPVQEDDTTDLRCVVTASNRAGTLAAATVPVRITHAPPVVAAGLADRSFDLAGGTREIETAGGFAGVALTFSVTGAGAGIDPATGLVSIPVSAALDAAPVTVTASNSGGSAAITFGVTVALAGSVPSVLSAPALSGAGRIGSPVSVAEGVWGGVPAPTLVLRWQRNGADIPGATGATYTPVPADDKADLRCVVTASNSFGTASATTGTVKVAYAAPVAAGNLFEEIFDQDGGVQTVDAAPDFTVAGDPGLGGVSWSVSGAGASIDGAGVVSIPTSSPVSAEAVTVTATNSGGSAESVFLVTVEGETGAAPFEAALSPSIATPGTHVTAVPVHADGSGPTGNETFQWHEDGVAIPGATWPTYVARESHVSAVDLTCSITDPVKGTALSAAAVVTDAAYPGSGAATNAATRLSQYNALPLSGGTIWCAAGDYAAWNVPARLFTGPVTIRSVDPDDPAVFLAVNFTSKSKNIIFRDIKYEYRPKAADANWLTINTIEGAAEKITLLDCELLGGPCVNPSERYYYAAPPIEAPGYGVGRMVRIGSGATDVAFIGCRWHDMSAGLSCRNDGVARITVEECESWGNSGDAYVFWDTEGLRFKRNVIRDARASQEAPTRFDPPLSPDNRDHIDGTQFANSSPATAGIRDAWISDNIYHSGQPKSPGVQTNGTNHTTDCDSWIQSMFLSATLTGSNRHSDVTIVNNLIYGSHQWGLLLNACDGGLIENNTVIRNHAQDSPAPNIALTVQNCTDVIVRKNVCHVLNTASGNTGVTLDDNLVIPQAASGAQTQFVGGLVMGSSMAQLQPVPGGTILTGGYGATYTSESIVGGIGGGGTPSSGDPITLDALPFNRFVFNSADNATATVTLRGTGTSGDIVHIRGESGGGSTAWSSGTAVDGSGNWEATLSVPLALWDEWYTPAARIGTDDNTRVTGANTFGCGHVVGFMGQSEMAYIFNNNSYSNGQPAAAGLIEQNTVFSIVNEGQGGSGRFSPATAAWTNQTTASKSCVYLANILAAGAPGRKWHLIDLCEVGSARRQLFDDAQPYRLWSDFENTVNEAIGGSRASGANLTEVGHLVECWYTSEGWQVNWERDYTPFYTGRTAEGASFPLGGTNVYGSKVDHFLWDLTGANRGLFSTNTKWTVLAPNPYRSTSVTTTYGAIVPNMANSGLTMQAFHANARFDGIRGHHGPTPNYLIGRWDGSTWQDSIHPGINDLEGTPYYAMHLGVALLNAVGISLPSPKITGVSAPAGGAYADVTVSLPNDGTLTTGRIRRGLGVPTPNPAYRQPAHGFEIRRGGDTWAGATPLGFTAMITDTGSGSPRTGTVRITPTVPFANGDRIGYLRGGATGLLDYQAHNAAKLVLDTLVENVPGLTTTNAPYDGIPVDPDNSDDLVVSLGAGSAFTPAWQTASGAMAMTAAGSDFTFAKTGVKKHAIVVTFAPDGVAANQCLLYSKGAFQVWLSGGTTLAVQHVNTFAGAMAFNMTTIPGWSTKDFALVINIDTAQANGADRLKAVLVDLSDGTEYDAGATGSTTAYALDADTQAYMNGALNALAAQNGSNTMDFNGAMERAQTFIGVNVDTTDLGWLHVGGVLQDPAGIDAAPAVGGGTLISPTVGTSVKVLDFAGATLVSGVNAGAGPDYAKTGAGSWVAR